MGFWLWHTLDARLTTGSTEAGAHITASKNPGGSGRVLDFSVGEQGTRPLLFSLLDVVGVGSPGVAMALRPEGHPGLAARGGLVPQKVVHGASAAAQHGHHVVPFGLVS
jgi:hypothetical protein